MNDSKYWLDININHHDDFAGNYASTHSEIYNQTEQDRLQAALHRAFGEIGEVGENVSALDFGAGAGNLTNHLLSMGLSVTASDVSEGCLNFIEKKHSKNFDRLSTSRLNGKDLSQFEDGQFDFVATYSVLHHVPDYLFAVKEMARVVKPGGVLFIDHESSPSCWQESTMREEYYEKYWSMQPANFWSRWSPAAIFNRLLTRMRKVRHPRYHPEGDIHIWHDDHIEWNLIEKVVRESGFEQINFVDYLVCREKGRDPVLYEEYKDRINDMRLFTSIKK
jgi:2-polyprenyl-3-methyl-5-hydroxy-6-metoxy-1,4-benzoquinol methylase